MASEKLPKIIAHFTRKHEQTLEDEVNTILASAQPVTLKVGTMEINQLLRAAHEMWDGLDELDIAAIIDAMNNKACPIFMLRMDCEFLSPLKQAARF